MLDGEVLGALTARVVFPFFLVWLVYLVVTKFSLARATALTFTRRGLAYAVVLFVILLATTIRPALASPDEPRREVQVLTDKRSGYSIKVDNDPAWLFEERGDDGASILLLATPLLVAPPLTMAVIDNKTVLGKNDELEHISRFALRGAADNFSVPSGIEPDIEPAAYGDITGYQSRFNGTANGKSVAVKVFVGARAANNLFTLYAYTFADKDEHLERTTTRIWNTIEFEHRTQQ